MRTIRPASAHANAIALVMLIASPGSSAASVADIAKKYSLTGTWAADCAKPADRTNPHVVYTVLDGDRLQRETKIVPDKSVDVSIAISLVEVSAGELLMAWKTNEGGIANRVRASQGQMQVLDSTRDSGEKLIVNGRRTRDNVEAPTFNKCS
jgi:hypothetical protein